MKHTIPTLSLLITSSFLLIIAGGCDRGPQYADGSYQTSGDGIHGPVNVTVDVKDGTISAVTVTGNNETQGIGSLAIDALPAAIVEAQGIEGVDDISGATVTSKAIKDAVSAALNQAAE